MTDNSALMLFSVLGPAADQQAVSLRDGVVSMIVFVDTTVYSTAAEQIAYAASLAASTDDTQDPPITGFNLPPDYFNSVTVLVVNVDHTTVEETSSGDFQFQTPGDFIVFGRNSLIYQLNAVNSGVLTEIQIAN